MPTAPADSVSSPLPPPIARARANPAWISLALLIPILAGALIGYERWSNPRLDHGDVTTDANILNAAATFEAQGFRPTWGLPTLDTYRGGAEGSTPDLYITYPPGAYWWHMLLRKCGLDELREFRIAAVVASTLAALLFVLLCQRLSGSWMIAALAGLLMVATRPFVEFADNIHYLTLSRVTLLGTMLAWLAFERDRTAGRRPVLLPGEEAPPSGAAKYTHNPAMFSLCAGLFALDSLLNFEHTLFILLFCTVRALLARRRPLILSAMLLGFVPVLVLALRIGQSALALGGFRPALAAFRGKFTQRTGLADPDFTWNQLLSVWVERLGGLGSRVPGGSRSAEFAHPILTLPVMIAGGAMLVMLLATSHLSALRRARAGLGGGLLLLAGALTWWVAMREHALVHGYVVLLLLPGLSLVLASLIAAGFAQRCAHTDSRHAARPLTPGNSDQDPRFIPVRWFAPIGAGVLLVACLLPMRGSFTLNRHWNLNREVQGALAARDASERAISAAAEFGGFSGVARLVMFQHDAHLAFKLGIPFDNPPHPAGTFRRPAEGEALLIQGFAPAGRAAALAAARTASLPSRIGPGDSRYFFFAGDGPHSDTRIAFEGGWTITRFSHAPTLDGESRLLSVLLEGPLRPREADSLTFIVAVRDAQSGRTLHRARAILSQRLWDSAGAVAWVALPRDGVVPGTRIEVSLRRRPGGPPMRILADGLQLPAGSRLMDDHATIAFDVFSTANRGVAEPPAASHRP